MKYLLLLLILPLIFHNTNLEHIASKKLKKYYQHDIILSTGDSFHEGKIYRMLNNTDFVYIGKSRSRFDDFEFMVLFDEDKTIKLVKVLIYRENYGGEIASKRWLKQWIGINKPKYMVDAISGATISVNSLKMSINTLLKKL